MFGHLLGWYTIYAVWGLLPPNGILLGAKLTLRSSLAFSYIGSMALVPWASAKLCSALSSCDRAAIPFATGQSKCLVKKYVAHSGCGNNQYQPKTETHLITAVNGAQLRRCLELKHIRKTSIYTKALSVKVFTTELIFSYSFWEIR